MSSYPILEFDATQSALLNPRDHIKKDPKFPKIVVFVFSYKILEKWRNKPDVKQIAMLGSASGPDPIYAIEYKGENIGFKLAHVGAPLCVGSAEEVVALGAETLVYFGSCGVLDKSIKAYELIIPSRAIRDEGVSYHYQAPSTYNHMDIGVVSVMKDVFQAHKIQPIETTCWTTDAFYRETKNKMMKRKEEGAKVVDMEVASLIAFSQFRNVRYAHFLYTADNLDAPVWDKRTLSEQGLSKADLYMTLGFDIGLRL
jgi:uridine phosphorylase